MKRITNKSYPYSSLIALLQAIPVVKQNGNSQSWQPMQRSISVVNRDLLSGVVSKNSVLNIFNHHCQKQCLTHAILAHQQKGSCGFTGSISSTPRKQMLQWHSCCLGGTVLIAGNFRGKEGFGCLGFFLLFF